MSLFAELKRRNVFRVGIAYVVASWLLLQITDVLMSVLGLPEIVGKAVFLVLVIGFIPALVFSWAFEITPEGLKRDEEVTTDERAGQHTARKLDTAVIVMLAAVAALVIYDRMVPGATETPKPSATMEAATAPADITTAPAESAAPSTDTGISVAVLPFANMSPDPDNEFFADGISEELLNVLVDVEGLRVPSRTSSFAFKGLNMDIREIAAQLQVNHVLEGSVRKAGNQVRITAQLIDVSTDTHLWSETYDRALEDIFAVQDEIAGHIVEELGDVLAIEARTDVPTENLDAYTLYLQGRELFRRREEALGQAENLLARAVELDPKFAEAWGLRAMVQITLPGYVKEPSERYFASAMEYAERALALDSDQVDAELAIAQVRASQFAAIEALNRFEQAVTAHPRNTTARLWFAITLLETGYSQAALQQLALAAEQDPVHATVLDWLSRAAVAANHEDQVVPAAELAIQLGRHQARVPLIYHFSVNGTLADMERYLDESGEPLYHWSRWMFELTDDPKRLPEAMDWIDEAELAGLGYVAEYARLNYVMVAGSSEEFFSVLRRIMPVDDTAAFVVWLPASKRHRNSPAMIRWVEEMDYLELWNERGWPDLCRPVGDDDFECDG